MAALGALLAWGFWPQRRPAVFLIVATLGGETIDQALKVFFHRTRPEAFFGLAQPETYSFPSGHSMASCCFYGAAAALLGTRIHSRAARAALWAGAAVLVAAIGFSRVYLGFHYPTDVLGGYTAGLAWLAALWASPIRLGGTGRSSPPRA
jgi:undecaprenyl-diphosphatase